MKQPTQQAEGEKARGEASLSNDQFAAFSTAWPALCTSLPAPSTVLHAATINEPVSKSAANIFLVIIISS